MAGRSALCIHFLLCRLLLLWAPGMTLAQPPLMNRVSSVSPTNYPCAASITMTVIGPGALGQVHQGFGNMPSDVRVRLQGEQAPCMVSRLEYGILLVALRRIQIW